MNLSYFLIAILTFFLVDMAWLGIIAKDFYKAQIGHLMKSDVNWVAALIFYVLFVIGLVVFVITPSIEAKSLVKAISLGALFGLVTYATYDLTNLAVTKDWPLLVTIVDLIWGMTLSVVVSAVTYLVVTNFNLQ